MVFLIIKIKLKYSTDMPPKLQWGNSFLFSCCWWGRIQNLKSFGFFRICCLQLGVRILYKFIFSTQKIKIKKKLKLKIKVNKKYIDNILNP